MKKKSLFKDITGPIDREQKRIKAQRRREAKVLVKKLETPGKILKELYDEDEDFKRFLDRKYSKEGFHETYEIIKLEFRNAHKLYILKCANGKPELCCEYYNDEASFEVFLDIMEKMQTKDDMIRYLIEKLHYHYDYDR